MPSVWARSNRAESIRFWQTLWSSEELWLKVFVLKPLLAADLFLQRDTARLGNAFLPFFGALLPKQLWIWLKINCPIIANIFATVIAACYSRLFTKRPDNRTKNGEAFCPGGGDSLFSNGFHTISRLNTVAWIARTDWRLLTWFYL